MANTKYRKAEKKREDALFNIILDAVEAAPALTREQHVHVLVRVLHDLTLLEKAGAQ